MLSAQSAHGRDTGHKPGWRERAAVILLAFILAGTFLVLRARPVAATVGLDLSVVSPYISLRQITADGETDLIAQAYGLSLHALYLGDKSGFQLELDYTQAREDLGGRGTTIAREEINLKYPRRKEDGDDGSSIYYWLLSYGLTDAGDKLANDLTLRTALIGVEVYNVVMESGTFAMGTGIGWRELAIAGYNAGGYAASAWLEFTVQLSGDLQIRFKTATTWAQPECPGYTAMERDTSTSIGLGLRF
ncbi:MAG: hypothetical protein ACM3ZC_09230 [Bacteroidota bacterium]